MEPYEERILISSKEVFSEIQPDKRSWAQRVAHLLKLIDPQYSIDERGDWYAEHNCFIGQYGPKGDQIGLLCCDYAPNEFEQQQFIDFIQSRKEVFYKLIIAIQGEGEKSTQSFHNHQLEYRYESELLDRLLPLKRYYTNIHRQLHEIPLEGSDRTLDDLYVPVAGQLMSVEKDQLTTEKKLENVEAYLLDWLGQGQENAHLAILGEYGQGKSVLSQKIAYEVLDNYSRFGRIPILIELRGKSPRNLNELGILNIWAQQYQISSESLLELHRAGKLLIILDGFDEMDLAGDTELLFDHFNQLWALARVPHSRIIITGRPNLFIDDQERRQALGLVEARTHLPYAKAIYLEKLNPDQIKEALRSASIPTQQGILKALEKAPTNSSFAELITRPSTLFQISTIWDKTLAERSNELNSATVIESFLQKAYDRQERKAANVLTSNERHYFMMGIAIGMMLQTGYTNQIRYNQLKELVEKLWSNFPEELPPYRNATDGPSGKGNLRYRLREQADPLGVIVRDVQAAGVLVQDLSGRDLFRFAHKSYLEYLISACYATLLLNQSYDRSLSLQVKAIVKTFNFDSYKLLPSREVEQFTAEFLAMKVEVKDSQGKVLPVKGNEKAYSKALFQCMKLPLWANIFPNLTAWLTLHKVQRSLLYIFFWGISIIVFLSLQSLLPAYISLYSLRISLIMVGVYCIYMGFSYDLKRDLKPYHFINKLLKTNPDNNITLTKFKSPITTHSSKMRFYITACRALEIQTLFIPNTYKLIISNKTSPKLFKYFVLLFVQLTATILLISFGIFTLLTLPSDWYLYFTLFLFGYAILAIADPDWFDSNLLTLIHWSTIFYFTIGSVISLVIISFSLSENISKDISDIPQDFVIIKQVTTYSLAALAGLTIFLIIREFKRLKQTLVEENN